MNSHGFNAANNSYPTGEIHQTIVPLDTSRQVKIWCGGGSVHVILDIAGYYL